jgi:multiple antibiotic resistance protein
MKFWLCFVPLFFAVDPLGILPLFLNLTGHLEQAQIRRIIIQSTSTALVVALAFIAIGKVVFNLLGITFADFMIAGGVLLFVLSLSDMLSFEKKQNLTDHESLGAVPIGVPLIVGPAVFTTMLLLSSQYGVAPTVLALIANIALVALTFFLADPISRILGKAGSKTISKLASLILAAIGVMLVRRGIVTLITSNHP